MAAKSQNPKIVDVAAICLRDTAPETLGECPFFSTPAFLSITSLGEVRDTIIIDS